MRFVFGVSHFFGIIIENLTMSYGLVYWEHINSHLHTDSMSSKPSGGFFVLVVRILGMDSRSAQDGHRETLILKWVHIKHRFTFQTFQRPSSRPFKLMFSNTQPQVV